MRSYEIMCVKILKIVKCHTTWRNFHSIKKKLNKKRVIVPENKKKMASPFKNLASEILLDYFCFVTCCKQVTNSGRFMGGEELDCTSWWRSGNFLKRMRIGSSHCNHLWKILSTKPLITTFPLFYFYLSTWSFHTINGKAKGQNSCLRRSYK